MSLFTFHLLQTDLFTSVQALFSPLQVKQIPGLVHAECMMAMTLGSPIFSTSRVLPRQLVVFAQWKDEEALDLFLASHKLGKKLSKGWYLRLSYLRKWGHFTSFNIPSESLTKDDPEAPVVAVTIARMKLPEVPRFIEWGRPVEKLVRDHPETLLALAATRLPNTVSTFSIWKTQKEMVKMVHGRSSVPKPERHAKAMKERERKDFHYEFTTLRFKPIAEHGEWKGKRNIIPGL